MGYCMRLDLVLAKLDPGTSLLRVLSHSTASILHSVANASIAPNLIEVGFMSILNVLIEMLLSKEIDSRKACVQLSNISTFLPFISHGYIKTAVVRV